MGKPIANVFGSTATMNTTTPSNPVLQIPYLSISTASAWGTAPTSATTSGEAWLTAILLNAKAYFDTITDSTNYITIGTPTQSIQTRNGVQVRGYSQNITIFVPDAGLGIPDPDLVP